MKSLSALTLFFAVFINTLTYAQTSIPGGDISGTWLLAESPYLINGDITIPDNLTLIIEPGVKVEFQGHYSLNVQGRLLAVGTEADSILFTVNDTTGFSLYNNTLGGWGGIRFSDTPVNNDSSKISYCCLEYGKAIAPGWPFYAGGAICILQFGKVKISDCLIQNNFSTGTSEEHAIAGGLYLFKSNIIVKNTTFLNNHSHGGGAIYFDESNPIFENNVFKNNYAYDGGGVAMGGESYPSFKNDTFMDNDAENQGGGISFWEPAIVTCESVTFSDNSARFGAGIGVWDTELQVDNCLFSGNHATEWGGGIAGDMATLHITNCTFSNDTSDWGAGGLHIFNSVATVKNCTFAENRAEFGGGLYLSISDVTIENNLFEDNQANSGGAATVENADPIFKNNTFNNNYAAETGGAIALRGENNATFTNDIFTDNQAVHSGGGMLIWESSVIKCNKVEVTGNKAEWGAGIGISGAELQADSCLFLNNHASSLGGGMASDYGTLILNYCTFRNDSSDWGSGGLHLDHSDAIITNCKFEQNQAPIGGGLHSLYSQVTIEQNDFLNNTSDTGGGIHMEESDGIIEKCNFQYNRALNGEGGAIAYTADSTIFGRSYKFSIRETEFADNTASSKCGAIRIEQLNPDFSVVDIVLDSCQFHRNHSYSFGSLRIIGSFEDFVLSNSFFCGNTSELHSAGPGFSNKAKGKVSNCVFYSNYASFTDSTKNAHGASLQTEAEVHLINCTFTDTSSAPGNSVAARRGAKAFLTNCILWGCGNNPIVLTTAADLPCSANINYCDIENGTDSIKISDSSSILNWGAGNIKSDPLFVDLLNGDLHLQNSSPCIGSGKKRFFLNEQWFTAPVRDIEGNLRPNPQNSEADMGAYENELGVSTITGISEIHENSKTLLFQNYPNPFSHITSLKYHLSSLDFVELTVYNIHGQRIKCLVSELQPAGTYTRELDMTGLKNGLYICKLRTNTGLEQIIKLVKL